MVLCSQSDTQLDSNRKLTLSRSEIDLLRLECKRRSTPAGQARYDSADVSYCGRTESCSVLGLLVCYILRISTTRSHLHRQFLFPINPSWTILHLRLIRRIHLARSVPTRAGRRQEETSDAERAQEQSVEATGDWSILSRNLLDVWWIHLVLQDARTGILGTELHLEVGFVRAAVLVARLTMSLQIPLLESRGIRCASQVLRSVVYRVRQSHSTRRISTDFVSPAGNPLSSFQDSDTTP